MKIYLFYLFNQVIFDLFINSLSRVGILLTRNLIALFRTSPKSAVFIWLNISVNVTYNNLHEVILKVDFKEDDNTF